MIDSHLHVLQSPHRLIVELHAQHSQAVRRVGVRLACASTASATKLHKLAGASSVSPPIAPNNLWPSRTSRESRFLTAESRGVGNPVAV